MGESELHLKRAQVGLELLGGLEHDAVHAQLGCGLGVGGYVIYVDGLVGADFGGLQGCFVNDGVGFAGSYTAGVDANGKPLEEGISFFQVRDVQRVGVGQQREAILPSQFR